MKHSDSTEMDRLLRRHARRNGETLRAGAERSGGPPESNIGAHLDADELNAYAEGALPEAARSRYFAHLADCDSCRKLVTDLTLAATATTESKARVEAAAPGPSGSWRGWFSAIFSPPVLRYGVPALALLAVIVVAIVAVRTQRDSSFVAQNNETSNSVRSMSNTNSNALAQAPASTADESHSASNSANVAGPGAQTTQPETSIKAAATPLATPLPVDDNAAPPVLADKPAAGQTATTANKGTGTFGEDSKRPKEVAAEAAPPPAPQPLPAQTKSGTDTDERKRDGAEEQAKAAKEKDNAPAIAGAAGGVIKNAPAANEDKVARGRTESRSDQGASTARKAAPKSEPAKREVETQLSSEARSVETRSVGGRHFRRQGSAWVDTAYNSSRPTTNVARGSEQYRALVADEPGLRTITQQLAGEVIVVWKSNAYRFY